jgi:hypothetical protein
MSIGLLEYCIGRVWSVVITGLQFIRVWGGAILAAGCCLPLAAVSLTLMGCHSLLGLGLGEAQHLVLLPLLAVAPLVLSALGGPPPYK